jgi:hypothetical protein
MQDEATESEESGDTLIEQGSHGPTSHRSSCLLVDRRRHHLPLRLSGLAAGVLDRR